MSALANNEATAEAQPDLLTAAKNLAALYRNGMAPFADARAAWRALDAAIEAATRELRRAA